MEEFLKMLPLLIPAILIEVILAVVAYVDLYKRKRVRFDSKLIWALIILIQIIGPIIYLVFGRRDDE